MRVFISSFLLLAMSITSYANEANHPNHEKRAYLNTIHQLAHGRSDYHNNQTIRNYVSNHVFNTEAFIEMISYVRSDYYRYETSKYAMRFVATPLTFNRVTGMLQSRYYQRQLTSYIVNSPRYKKRLHQKVQHNKGRSHHHQKQQPSRNRGTCSPRRR